jgi:hypothetical protein
VPGRGPGAIRRERKWTRAPRTSDAISANRYGRWYRARATRTATRLEASRLKNQTPGSRPPSCTYVRTLISTKLEMPGIAGRNTGRAPRTTKGTRPTQAWPA